MKFLRFQVTRSKHNASLSISWSSEPAGPCVHIVTSWVGGTQTPSAKIAQNNKTAKENAEKVWQTFSAYLIALLAPNLIINRLRGFSCTRSCTWSCTSYPLLTSVNYRTKFYPYCWYCQSKQHGHSVQAACSHSTAAWTEIIHCISGGNKLRCRFECSFRCRKNGLTGWYSA